jgi:trimethylamine:corrinoid methyltransferase-like protein
MPFASGEAEASVELMSTEDLIEATKLVTSMADVGLGGYVPGVPRDVPYQLQAILEYRIGAEFGPRVTLDTLNPPEALPYLFDMAEALGQPMESGGMFTVSPLRLSGYEFDVAVRHAARWKRFWVTTYPMVGATAPVRVRSAWVLSIAEAIGGAITLNLLGEGKPVHMSIGMFPFDLRTFAAAGGMPECVWMYWASSRVTRFYDPRAGYSMMLGTQAKVPGVQSGYEKAMAGTFGVLTGCDDLHYVGVMSFDDIFSPVQMVLDCELRDMLGQLRRGIPSQDPEEWLDDIAEGVSRGYVAADTTLDNYRDTYWFPSLFDRASWHSFASGHGHPAQQRARENLRDRLESYDFRPPSRIEDVRAVFDRAWHQLGGDPSTPYLPLLYNE